MLKTFMLGNEGIRYALTCLKEGGALSRFGQKLVSANEGVCFAPLPEHVTLERALQFETGGLMSRRKQFDWIEDRMLSFCKKARENLLVVEDQVMRRGDKGISDISSDIFFVGNEVYYYVGCEAASANKIETALREVRSFLSVSFLICTSGRQCLESGHTIDAVKLGEMAENIVEILISAYDQEGVVVWSRSPPDGRRSDLWV